MKHIILYILIGGLAACTKPDGVEPAQRSTFVKFFGTSITDEGYAIEYTDDGDFICVGTGVAADTLEYMHLFKTDAHGYTVWSKSIPQANGLDIKVLADGYLVVGDSIKELSPTESSNAIFVIKTDFNGNITQHITIGDTSDEPVDYHGSALTIAGNGTIIVLGIRENDNDQEETILVGINPTTFEMGWLQSYSLEERSYEVSRSVLQTLSGNYIWASSAYVIPEPGEEDEIDSYITVPIVAPNSENINDQGFGRNTIFSYFAGDIQPGVNGYGVIGTTTVNGNEDIFFFRTNQEGFIIEGSEKTFGGTGSDEGLALSPTSDGGFILLGALGTTVTLGNGGKDFYLVKIDAFGNTQWKHNLGGNGDEIGNAVRQTADGGYVIFGTHNFQGVSMMCMVKTNSQGRLIEE